jgi:hypothetical protein
LIRGETPSISQLNPPSAHLFLLARCLQSWV